MSNTTDASVYFSLLEEIKSYSPTAKLIAVSKLQSVEKIKNLNKLGQTDFAENYVQEAIAKQVALAELNIHWHFIGGLQKNKAKLIVGNFDLIHSIDSVELAQKINSIAEQKMVVQKILIQVNLSKEPSKNGFFAEDLDNKVFQLSNLKNIDIKGLMTMPPLFENPELARPYFKQLKIISTSLNLPETSMGTSTDYKIALQEGSTMIRLGTVLFGERLSK